MIKNLLSLFIFCLLSVQLRAQAAINTHLELQTSQVDFFAVGKPSLLKINGNGGKVSGDVEIESSQIKGILKVNLNEFTTGIALRDQHMKEKYLETIKYPEAVFELQKIDLPDDFLTNKRVYSAVPFSGKLSLHGVEKQISGTALVDTTKDILTVVTDFKILVSDHKIDIPTYLGIKVADEVAVKVKMNINVVKK